MRATSSTRSSGSSVCNVVRVVRHVVARDEVLDRDRNRRALIYVPHTVMLYDKEGGGTVVVLKEVTKGEEEQS